MDPSLPVLVTRLPDRRALARLLRAALRHEVAQVALSEAPNDGPHTLNLHVIGAPNVSLLAEPMGAPKNGEFPLRLRPLHRAQAAELYALLEEDPPSDHGPPVETAAPVSPVPDTIASGRTLGYESPGGDSAPIARAMSGLAPPPVTALVVGGPAGPTPIDPRVTARLEWPRAGSRPDDPRRTAPSATWGPPVQTRREDPRKWAQPSQPPPDPRPVDDPRRTARSASWLPGPAPPPAASAADADDPSLSVSVVFEPDALPDAVIAATNAAIAAAKADVLATIQDAGPLPADGDGPSLSVSVVFEPDSESPPTPTIAVDAPPVPMEDDAPAGDDGFFFDEALASLPMVDERAHAASDVPPTEGSPPVFTPRTAAQAEDDDGGGDAGEGGDDDDADTLIRLPSVAPRAKGQGPLPAAGRAPSAEDLTPTDTEMIVPPPRVEGGRKKKTTRRGKPKSKSRHPADADAFAKEEPTTSRRSKAPESDPDVSADPLVRRKIADGKYVIESLIGAGAAGAVYRATHKELRRTVAIKVLHPHYQQDPQFMKSFRGEALAASQLDHPNVMRVLDFGQEHDGLVYIVMEYLSGRTLQSLLDEERRLQTDRAVEIMIQVCAALSVAHDHGIIHRDIKPDNIMLVPSRNDEGGTFELVKVCDFGIAALQKRRGADEDPESSLYDNMNVIAGTPEYMSPEQARGIEIDARSDVYACGICLYELVTGRPPFLGENAAEILIKQLEEPPRPPSQLLKGLDPIVEEIILRAIQKDPHKRQQSARELRVELKESIDPGDAGGPDYDHERSIVENVPVLDDPASGFPAFFIGLSSAICRFGRFERGHPEAAQALKELVKATKAALRGRREITFALARRDGSKTMAFCAVTGHGEVADLRRLLGSQLYGSFGDPFVEAVTRKGIAAMTLREGLPELELQYLIEMMLGPHAHDELRKELLSKPLRQLSVLFISDVVGRDRKLTWKVGLCAARLARDLSALSNVRGISLKKMREIREDLVSGVAHLLTRGDEVRQFIFNADLVDDAVANLRGFSGFQVSPLVFEHVLHEPAVETVALLLTDFDKGEIDRDIIRGYLRAFATRLVGERSPKSDAVVAELHRRSIVTDADMPRDLVEQIRAESLADALVRDPSQFLRTLDFIQAPDDYGRELATLEAAMAVLARRAEAGALLAAISVLARHAKGGGAGKPGPRETHALRAMKSMIDKQRLVPIANALLVGPNHQREAARQLLVLAGSVGAHALYIAREGLTDPSGRPVFVKVFRETGPAGWSLLSSTLPRLEVQNDTDIAFVEDLLRAMPDRQDPALGEAVAKFLAHPRLRPAALAAIVPLWGERARKPLMDALEFAEEPARIVAVTELRRIRGIDEQAVNVIERLLTMKGSASEELRAAAAAALADVGASVRTRAIALLGKGVEGKRGLVAMLRGDGSGEESLVVTEAMARALVSLDRPEGVRALKARIAKSEGLARSRLTALLQQV